MNLGVAKQEILNFDEEVKRVSLPRTESCFKVESTSPRRLNGLLRWFSYLPPDDLLLSSSFYRKLSEIDLFENFQKHRLGITCTAVNISLHTVIMDVNATQILDFQLFTWTGLFLGRKDCISYIFNREKQGTGLTLFRVFCNQKLYIQLAYICLKVT